MLLHESTQQPMINSHIWRSSVQAAVMVTNAGGCELSLPRWGWMEVGGDDAVAHPFFITSTFPSKPSLCCLYGTWVTCEPVGVTGCYVTATWEVFYCPPSTWNNSKLTATCLYHPLHNHILITVKCMIKLAKLIRLNCHFISLLIQLSIMVVHCYLNSVFCVHSLWFYFSIFVLFKSSFTLIYRSNLFFLLLCFTAATKGVSLAWDQAYPI